MENGAVPEGAIRIKDNDAAAEVFGIAASFFVDGKQSDPTPLAIAGALTGGMVTFAPSDKITVFWTAGGGNSGTIWEASEQGISDEMIPGKSTAFNYSDDGEWTKS